MFSSDAGIRLSQKPSNPPPEIIPQYCGERNNINSGLIRQYINLFVYVWMTLGNSFWICPVDSMGDVLFCYAWDGADWKFIRLSISGVACFYKEGDRHAR